MTPVVMYDREEETMDTAVKEWWDTEEQALKEVIEAVERVAEELRPPGESLPQALVQRWRVAKRRLRRKQK
jgi:hypothetical protein